MPVRTQRLSATELPRLGRVLFCTGSRDGRNVTARPPTGAIRYASRGGNPHIPVWGPEGSCLRLCSRLSYFLMTRSDEMFAADSGWCVPYTAERGKMWCSTLTAHSWETSDGGRHTREVCCLKRTRVDSEQDAGAESSFTADGLPLCWS